MFQILEMHEAHLASVTNRIEKHGEDDVPAVSLGFSLTSANTILDSIDPAIRASLYKAVDGQPDLPGVETSTPALRCNSFERHILPTKYEGWSLEVDDGIDETEPMVFGGTKVDKFQIEAKQGGSVVIRFRAGTSDVDAEKLGKLGMHVGQSIWIKLRAPEKQVEQPVQPDAEDDDEPTAGDLFVNGAAGEDDGTGEDRPLTEAEVFPGAQENKAVVPITTKRKRKGLGSDAEQAQRQAEELAKDPTQAPADGGCPFPTVAKP